MDNEQLKKTVNCDVCGRYETTETIFICPKCGKKLCKICVKIHNCEKPLIPPKNTQIAVDQQNYYKTLPKQCDGCGEYFSRAELKKCKGCKKILCKSCRKNHKCYKTSYSDIIKKIIFAVILLGIVIIGLQFIEPLGENVIPTDENKEDALFKKINQKRAENNQAPLTRITDPYIINELERLNEANLRGESTEPLLYEGYIITAGKFYNYNQMPYYISSSIYDKQLSEDNQFVNGRYNAVAIKVTTHGSIVTYSIFMF